MFFDLEGPLCPIDHAAEVMERIGRKLGKKQDFYQLFQMISSYDDELFLIDKKEDYWPGDTLKLIAPIVVSFITEEEMRIISERVKPTPGARELFVFLHKKNIPTYIISTSYTQHAYTIAKKLNHPLENVCCTNLDFSLKPENTELLDYLFDELFPRYLKSGLTEVKTELDDFFFNQIPHSTYGPIFNSTIVCGGGRKRENAINLLLQHSLQSNQAIVVGDSITDIQMLEYIRNNGGIAISFNGNEHSLSSSTIAFSGRTILPLKKIISSFPETKQFVVNYNKSYRSGTTKKEEYFHLLENISEEEFHTILLLQQKYRKILREKAACLT